jgi:DNA-binding PadR family transcriptional regulator
MRHLSVTAASILQAIADGAVYGFDIIDRTGLPSGTVYPALSRLERDGYVRSSWEAEDEARAQGRPARRNYRVTAPGVKVLKATADRYRALLLGTGRRPASSRS